MPIMEVCGTDADIGGYVVQPIWEGGARANVGGGAVQIPGATLGPNR